MFRLGGVSEGSKRKKREREVESSCDAAIPAPNMSYVPGELVDGISDVPIAVIRYSNVNRNTPADHPVETLALAGSEQATLHFFGEPNLSPAAIGVVKGPEMLKGAPRRQRSVSFSSRNLHDRPACTDVTSPVTSRHAPALPSSSKNQAPGTPDSRSEDDDLLSPLSSGLVSRYKNLYEASTSSTSESCMKESYVSPSSDTSRVPIRHLKDDSSPFNQNLQFLKENLHFTKSTGAIALPKDAFQREVPSRKPKRLNEKKGFLSQGVRQMLGKISSASSSENILSPRDAQTTSGKTKASKTKKLMKLRKRSSGNGRGPVDEDGYSTVDEDKAEKLPKGRINYVAVPDNWENFKKASDRTKTPAYPYASRDVIQDLVDLEPLAELRSYDFVHHNLPKRSDSSASQDTNAAVSASAAFESVLSPSRIRTGSLSAMRRNVLSDPLSVISSVSPVSAMHQHRDSFTSATSEEHYTEIHAALEGIIKAEDCGGPRPPTGVIGVQNQSGAEGVRRVNAKPSCPIVTGGPACDSTSRSRPNSEYICAGDASSIRRREGAVGFGPAVGVGTESSDSVSSSGPEGEGCVSPKSKKSQRSAGKTRNTLSRNFDKNVYARIAAGQLSNERKAKHVSLLERISSFASRRGKDKKTGSSNKKRKSSPERGALFHRGSVLGGTEKSGWGKDTLMVHSDATVPCMAEATIIAIPRPGHPSYVVSGKRLQSFGWNRYCDRPPSPAAEQSFSTQRKADICFPKSTTDYKLRLPLTTFGFCSSKNEPPPPVHSTPCLSIAKQPLNKISSIASENEFTVSRINTEQIYFKPMLTAFNVYSPDATPRTRTPIDYDHLNRVDIGDSSGTHRGSNSDLGESDVFYSNCDHKASNNYCESVSVSGRSPMSTFGREDVSTRTPAHTAATSFCFDDPLEYAEVSFNTLPATSFYSSHEGEEDDYMRVASIPKSVLIRKSTASRNTPKVTLSPSVSSSRSSLSPCLYEKGQDLYGVSSFMASSKKVCSGAALTEIEEEVPSYAMPRPLLEGGSFNINRRSSSITSAGSKKPRERIPLEIKDVSLDSSRDELSDMSTAGSD